MSVDTRLISDPYSSVDTSLCKSQDKFDFNFKKNPTNFGFFDEWIVWEGGIAFHVVYWLIIALLFFAIIHLLRRIFSWQWLTERLVGHAEPSQNNKKNKNCSGWIDEQAVGQDGATYLWFQARLMVVSSWQMVVSVVLIVLHMFGDKQGPDKHLSSTTLSNIGVNGIHPVFSLTVLGVLGLVMNLHGQERNIRSLASPNIPNTRFRNRRWLMISGLPPTTTADSLFDYLKDKFDSKGICRDGIKFAHDLTELVPVLDELKFLREVKRTMASSKPEVIQNRLLDFLCSDGLTEAVESGRVPRPTSLITKYDNVDAIKFYSEREATLSARKDEMLRNMKFTGTAFVRFNSPAEAKATKTAVRLFQQSTRFRNDVEKEAEFRPSKWSVEYAPPGSQINWPQLKEPRPFWKTLAVWLILAATYFLYIVLLAAPGYIVELLHLVGDGSDHFSLSWNVFILPTLASFFTHKLTEVVTNIDRYRHHQFVSSIEIGRLRSICNLSAVLYLIRMMATKPLAELFIGKFTYRDISWACLFFPEHGSFIACAIIVNTASGILMNHVRLEFLTSYLLKWFTFRSNAEQITWRKNYRLEFDFAANYAELTSNFGLTMLIFIMFPVIGVVSWVCSICRFFSDRAALMEMYAISTASPELHKEPIDQVICLSIFSPLALLGYRIIQMGSESVTHLVEASFLAPLCVVILYALYLIAAHWRFYWPQMIRLRQWFGYNPENQEEEEEEDVVDWSTYLQHEYDPITIIQSEQFSYKM
ncbi:hypothetical protein DAPPUDRAFT_331372 [Daphnia pulex]|uniref:CSC1/OSCA1-like cytosolic domain-containing protein n=1 Tax=Daphnia pulex TaxID=6669 RepID=E9HMA3_DAPPU|nr:hypothetical protein DAPPUDRAFT_331372 [Daphnia pulex]|eukprot:EFX67139.1 hypothetical protein DAPPUDRAFT_331372 [Daphnia pulex]